MKTKILITGSENVNDADIVIKAFDHLVSGIKELAVYSCGIMGVQSIIEKHCFSSGIEVLKFNMFDKNAPLPIKRGGASTRGRSNIVYVGYECDNCIYLNCNNEDIPSTPFSDLYFSLGPGLKNVLVTSYLRYKPIQEPKRPTISSGGSGDYVASVVKGPSVEYVNPTRQSSSAWDDYIIELNDEPKNPTTESYEEYKSNQISSLKGVIEQAYDLQRKQTEPIPYLSGISDESMMDEVLKRHYMYGVGLSTTKSKATKG